MKSERMVWMGFAALAAAVGLSVFWLPAPLPADAPVTSFSATRAFEHVKAIARAPHPTGSVANVLAREYLLAEMDELGLRPRAIEGAFGGVKLVNLYGELEGTERAKPPILLVSHYDSAAAAPGASDAASGVATILETVRALKARGPLRQTLGILLTDGEEFGMLGARAFIRDQPELLRDVRFVINLEARGNHGPVLMFETARDNARLIQLFSRTCPVPVASSFSTDIYRRLPNDTDFTYFLAAGKRGFNFSFIGGLGVYHTPQDTPENLSRRTLQHYGACVLPLVARLGGADAPALERLLQPGDATFFPLGRGLLAHYPSWLARALALVTAGLFVFVVGQMLWRSALRFRYLLLSLGVTLLAMVLSIGLGVGGVFGLARHFKLQRDIPFLIGIPHEGGILAGLLLVVVVMTWSLRTWLLRRANSAEGLASALVIWVALTIVSTVALPGASCLFTWPALCGTIALRLHQGQAEGSAGSWLLRIALTAMPVALLFSPTILLLHQAITIGIAPISMVLTALAVCLMPLRRRPNDQVSTGSNNSPETNPATAPLLGKDFPGLGFQRI